MAFALLCFGLVFVFAFMSDFRAALRSRRYLKTQGILNRSWIEQSHEFNSDREVFSPRVSYEYTAGGKKYVGRQLTVPARSKRTRREAEAALAPYTAGAPVDVWFDPDAPQQCFLKKTHPVEASFPVLFGGILAASGAIGLIAAQPW